MKQCSQGNGLIGENRFNENYGCCASQNGKRLRYMKCIMTKLILSAAFNYTDLYACLYGFNTLRLNLCLMLCGGAEA